MSICEVCFRHCDIKEGGTGFCGARICRDGRVSAGNYGRITSLALDPIEKKPLYRFYPGSMIVSVGSYGCNLRCPFCQNYEISWSDKAFRLCESASFIPPEDLLTIAKRYESEGNIGVAFTYNEPMIGYEYVLDTAKLISKNKLKTVLVTNGTAETAVLEELLPYVNAMNIDLKGFTDRYYNDVVKGSRKMVMDFIELSVKHCHVELTTLIIPGENDSDEEMRELASWISGLTDREGSCIGANIPLHISRFFPRFHMQDRLATDVKKIYHLKEVAEEKLKYVYTGNC